ncbi:Adenylosuccinate synthetase [Trichinella pseudospiralis]
MAWESERLFGNGQWRHLNALAQRLRSAGLNKPRRRAGPISTMENCSDPLKTIVTCWTLSMFYESNRFIHSEKEMNSYKREGRSSIEKTADGSLLDPRARPLVLSKNAPKKPVKQQMGALQGPDASKL